MSRLWGRQCLRGAMPNHKPADNLVRTVMRMRSFADEDAQPLSHNPPCVKRPCRQVAAAFYSIRLRARIWHYAFVTALMSLCKTCCSLRLSHLIVTPDQLFSMTAPASFLSALQITRAPILSSLDSVPVIILPNAHQLHVVQCDARSRY